MPIKIAALFALVLAGFLDSQAAGLPADERREIVGEIATIVERSYAVPELGAGMAARLREQLKSGAYDGLSSLQALAEKVDHDLKSVSNDHHMMLMYSPTRLSPDLGKTASITNPPGDPEEAQYRNDGISRIERLPGNVGYLKLERFFHPDQAADTIGAAMNAISSTDALIIDVRDNVGGHPGTVAFLCSYFFEHRKHLNDIVDRPNKRTTSFWTEPGVPGKRYLDKPVYVLVSHESYSAAEEFAYDLQALGRATIIGETTAGAANPSIPLRLSDHLVFYVPTGRALNPVTHTNWEGIGVKPNIVVEPQQALQRAQITALEALLASAPKHPRTEERRKALELLRKSP